jgi:hypothetical protein
VLLAGLLLSACNLLTGADEFVVDGDGDSERDGDSSSDGDGNPSDGDGDGSGAGIGSGGDTGSGGTTSSGPVATLDDATGVTITQVAFYQGVKSTVFANGSVTNPSLSLVANRPAVVRVFVDPAGASGAPITARLFIGSQAPIETVVSSLQSGTDGNFSSTINFDVPAAYLTPGATWRVELKEDIGTSAGPNPGATTGDGNLALEQSHALRVTLIPVQYQADGSNRMPDTSAAQLEQYRQLFMKLYPTTEVVLTVGPTFGWNQGISAGGNGWDTLLNAISEERQSAAAAFDEYYYGIFEPASSFGAFCGGGCVAGLGFIGEPGGEYSRAAIGLGFSGESATWTAVHEVGHNHGRPHSPCGGVSGADPGYPHSGGDIGQWGMDLFTKQLIDPGYKDLMSYCEPSWISDYVYEEVLGFMQATGGSQSLSIPAEELNQEYERVSFGPETASFLSAMTMVRPPMGEPKDVTVTTASGETKTVKGTFYAYDHIDGGVLFVKKGATLLQSAAIDLKVRGAVVRRAAAR